MEDYIRTKRKMILKINILILV